MKKVWILETFYSREEMDKSYKSILELLDKANKENNLEGIKAGEEMRDAYKKTLIANPNGRWAGFEGKTNYKEFCYCAKAALRRNPNMKFRVVKAEIPDDAKYWIGYINPEVNEGVYKYLLATKQIEKEKQMITITVRDFLTLCTEDMEPVTICDLANGEVKDYHFDTFWEACKTNLVDYELLSFDFYRGKLTLNIDTSEEQCEANTGLKYESEK